MFGEPKENWMTTEDAARHYGKTSQTIRNWCEDGFFLSLGVRLYRDPKNRWHIRLPDAELNHIANQR
jgi:hypothetical protein